jgi:hypothetical protein
MISVLFQKKNRVKSTTFRAEGNNYNEAEENLMANINYWKASVQLSGSRLEIVNMVETRHEVNAVTFVCEAEISYKIHPAA